MSYLYGDSTDSGLQINYIELLRDFLGFATQLLLSEHRITKARATVDERSQTMKAEVTRLNALGDSVLKTLSVAKHPSSQSATEQCIATLEKATQDTLGRAVNGLKQELARAEQELITGRRQERAANAKIIEHLLLNHELPDSRNAVDILANADGTGHIAEVKGSNSQGLHWRFSATIPETSHFQSLQKVAALYPELTIELPEMSGFVRKSVKLKPFRVFPLYICTCTHDEKGNVCVQLRSNPQPGDDTGLDVTWSPKTQTVSIVRMHKGDKSPAYEINGSEVQALVNLCQTLNDESYALVLERTKLLEILFNNKPLAECEAPTELIARLISRLGPVIRGIVEHSLGDKELVLKQVLANDRREEIFASKANLLEKIATVPSHMRGIFSPLGLGDLGLDNLGLDDIGLNDIENDVDFPQTEEIDIATEEIEAEQSVEIEVLEIEDQVALSRTALPLTVPRQSSAKSQVSVDKLATPQMAKPPMGVVSDLNVLEPVLRQPRAARASAPIPQTPSATLVSPVTPPRSRPGSPTKPPPAKAKLPSIMSTSEETTTVAGSVDTSTTNLQSRKTVVREDLVEIEIEDDPSGPLRLPRLDTARADNEDSIDIALAGLEYDG